MGEVMPTLDFEEIVIALRDQIERGRPGRWDSLYKNMQK